MTDSRSKNKKLHYRISSRLALLIITICTIVVPVSIGNWIEYGFNIIHLAHFAFTAVAGAIYFSSSKHKIIIDTILVTVFLSLLILIGAIEYGLSVGLLALLISCNVIIAVLHNLKISFIYSFLMVIFVAGAISFLNNDLVFPIQSDSPTFISAFIYSILSILISFALIIVVLIELQTTLNKSLDEVDAHGKQLEYLENYDALTGLSSPRLAQEQLELTLNMAKRYEFKVAVLHIDVNGFRVINEALGRDAGDYVLKEIAKRLKGLIRDTDIASRHSGDEFLVILYCPVSKLACDTICKRLIAAFDARVPYKDQEIKVNLSIGVAIYPDNGDTQFELRAKADKARYISKENLKHHFTFAD
ncbi:MAG: diguanylate cyclase (GGDEF)-like protein [Glaciecola sp.]